MNQVFDDCQIIISSQGEVLARKKTTYLVPGELEKINVSKKILDKINQNELEISVEEV